MKPVSIIVIGILFITNLYSQSDSTEPYVFWLRPYFENGVTFPNNEFLKDSYATNSIYHWCVGFRIGDPLKRRILPYFQYANSSFTVRHANVNNNTIKMDSTLKMEEYAVGFNIILRRINNSNVLAKVGYIDASLNNDYIKQSAKGKGFQVGIGSELKIFRRSWIYINYTYNYIKSSKDSYRDYDNQKISLGFMW